MGERTVGSGKAVQLLALLPAGMYLHWCLILGVALPIKWVFNQDGYEDYGVLYLIPAIGMSVFFAVLFLIPGVAYFLLMNLVWRGPSVVAGSRLLGWSTIVVGVPAILVGLFFLASLGVSEVSDLAGLISVLMVVAVPVVVGSVNLYLLMRQMMRA